MDTVPCTVIYLDRRLKEGVAKKDQIPPRPSHQLHDSVNPDVRAMNGLSSWSDQAEVRQNIASLLTIFNEVQLCQTSASCLENLTQHSHAAKASVVTIVLLDVPYDQQDRSRRRSEDIRTPSPTSLRVPQTVNHYFDTSSEPYVSKLLEGILQSQQARLSMTTVIPFAIISGQRSPASSNLSRYTKLLDAGAVDVLSEPLTSETAQRLALRAYKAYKDSNKDETSFLIDRRARKLSWVGVEETKPYSYLREAMVSGLMGGICNPDSMSPVLCQEDYQVAAERKDVVSKAIGSWNFSTHDFTDDELTIGAFLMLKHALQLSQLQRWRISDDDLWKFLHASRDAYNDFVLYHNFRHVCDVLQAIFYFLVQIGSLPPYRGSPANSEPSPLAAFISPTDALTLLISAIGHDVGHPGVNNAFLVALNAPLAQLYNDRSVLESFHCAAYSQILRRHWPSAFQDTTMRKLMINVILATDMSLHFKYMGDLAQLKEKLKSGDGIDKWSDKQKEDCRDLVCGLLIKCADISNVARGFNIAAQWASILSDEFSNQGNMEVELNIPTQLFGGPPVKDNIVKMAESQIGFMNIFARPLFAGVKDILPAMHFGVDQIDENRATWQSKIDTVDHPVTALDGPASPLSRSATSPISPVTSASDDKDSQETATTSTPPYMQAATVQPNHVASSKGRPNATEDMKNRSVSSPHASDRPRSSPVKTRIQPPFQLGSTPPLPRKYALQHARSQPDVRSPTSTDGSADLEGEDDDFDLDAPSQFKGRSMQVSDGVGNVRLASSPPSTKVGSTTNVSARRSSRLGAGLSKFLRRGRWRPASSPMVLPESEQERQELADKAQEN